MRVPGRKGPATAQGGVPVPPFVVCPVCHLRNDVTARFCRGCGLPLGAPRDPVRGTTTRRADLPSERGAGIAAVVSLAAIVVIAGIAGLLVFRGFESAPTTAGAGASATPRAVAAASEGPVPSPASSTAAPATSMPTDPDAEATEDPAIATEEPTETTDPDEEPTDRPTARPLSTRTTWTCEGGAIQDPLGGRWRITGARWGQRDGYDRLTFDLARLQGSTRNGAVVRMEFLRPARAASRYDVATPSGTRAIVITFDGPLALRTAITGRPGLGALSSVAARTDDEGVVHAVLGVEGKGCARLVANEWRNGDDGTTTAKLVVDIQR